MEGKQREFRLTLFQHEEPLNHRPFPRTSALSPHGDWVLVKMDTAPYKHKTHQSWKFPQKIGELPGFEAELSCRAFAKAVELSVADADSRTDDNYFGLSPVEPRRVLFPKNMLSGPIGLEEFESRLRVRSLFDIQ